MFQSFNEVLIARARDQATRTAFLFLRDGERDEVRVTYGEIDRQARAIAARLRETCAPGDRALLLYPPGLEFISAFFGCLYAGVIAVPSYPPDPTRLRISLARLQVIAADCGARAVLGTAPVTSRHAELGVAVPALRDATWIASDDGLTTAGGELAPVAADPASIAFLQYTSGSTAAPKGVAVSHGNILHNEIVICTGMELGPQSFGVGWLPLYHDMGLIGNVFAGVYAGFPMALMSPLRFVQSPIRLLRAISRYRATICGGPNFGYEHCIQRITEEDKATLDLSSWRTAFNGAEPIRADTMTRFTEAFAPCGFAPETVFPCYGLAESTLMVTGKRRGERFRFTALDKASLEDHRVVEAGAGATVTLTSCGCAGPGVEIEIVDPETGHRIPAGGVGEIWLAGPSVAQGYFGKPEATEHTFRARIAGDPSAGPFLRTGDLGFLRGGELYVAGRIKDLIVVRGRKLHPQDLERTAEAAHPALRSGSCAAFAIEHGGEEAIGLVAAIKGDGVDAQAVFGSLRQALTEGHQILPAALVLTQPADLPKTSSGKLQRHACREAFLSGTLRATAVWRADAVENQRP
jgi:acyl-CoA synthetase (AMP-forming)/AMP-acid ligase II